MTLKELLTKGEGSLSAQEAKTLAAQCRMDVETLYTLLEERGIKIIEDEADADVNLDVDSIIAEVENAENNSDELGLGGDDEEEAAEENPADLKAAMEAPGNRKEEIAEAAEIKMKYKGYIERERLIADKMHRLENIRIKGRFNYSEILEISTEGRQKLERIDPDTLAQASRIPGVSPSDINVLLILLGR